VGIVGDCSVGPHVLPHRLTGNRDRDILLHDLPKLLEVAPQAARARMWYIHDGAPAHFSRAVRGVLNSTYYDGRLSREGPTSWPPRLQDLNPLYLYMWGNLKTVVYAAPVDNEEALHHRNVEACQTIRNYPGIFERIRRSTTRRVQACIESHGGYFEN
jgi:hypothetical protein